MIVDEALRNADCARDPDAVQIERNGPAEWDRAMQARAYGG